ncbi:RDD family protein [Cesiribacter andamanensis]|uniref:RDD family protein n=1 Tax=Cesiribacter andamanensis AMV16 TaxID=1279009 RepID=M7N5J4_9BACT|nr:RDD family protein [Cesiribacter andamanensis]EMR02501.1 RDD family protein [Cesiribacter andamanensis AMV16]
MQKVEIQTTQNVLIDYEVAGLGDRIGAYLLDSLLTGAYYIVLILFNSEVYSMPTWLIITFILPPFLYHLLCEIFFNGQSLGKRQLHLKVVRLDGTQPGIGNYLLRWLLRPLDIWLYGSVAILTILINGKGQRLGDMAAGTTVVKYRPQQHNFDQQLYTPAPEQEAYEVQFPQVSRLQEKDVALIRETLRTYRLTGNAQPVQLMADKAQQLLGIETSMPPLKLLHTLAKDFDHLAGRP